MRGNKARSFAAVIAIAVTILPIIAPRCIWQCAAIEAPAASNHCHAQDVDSLSLIASDKQCASMTSFVLSSERPRSPIERPILHYRSITFRLDLGSRSFTPFAASRHLFPSAPPGASVPLRV